MNSPRDLDRRDFLRGSAAALVASAAPVRPAAASEPEKSDDWPHVRAYRTLGRTGLKISDVSFGSSRLNSDDRLVSEALERGINYFDTAETYTGGVSETTIGRALEGKREQVILASKVKCGASTRRDELMRRLEASLERLRTDRIDVYFNHAVNSVDRLKNPEWYEFVARAREQGKIRFSGISGHGGRLIQCLDHALDHDQIDVMLVAYNFGQDPTFYEKLLGGFDFVSVQPDLPRVIKKAKEKKVGVIAMKTLMGARLNDMRPYEHGDATFAQAAFRWVLQNPDVDGLIVSMVSRQKLLEYLGASGAQAVSGADLSLLRRYAHKFSSGYCRHGCSACDGACPHQVPIAEVLRTRMYARDYEDVDLARRDYAALESGAAACASCTHQSCLGSCPIGLQIPALTRDTHDRLA